MTRIDPKKAKEALARRRRVDPVWWFFNKADDPHSMKQKQILEGEGLFKAIKAGNRAGKSAVLGLDLAATLRNCHPYRQKPQRPLQTVFFCMSRQQAITVWKRKLLEICELKGPFVPRSIMTAPMLSRRYIKTISWDHTPSGKVPKFIEMKNGNTLLMAWSGTKSQEDILQGPAFDFAWMDEGACSDKLLNEVYGRLKDAWSDPMVPGYGGILWSATMTSDRYEGYQRFLEDCQNPDKPEWQLYELNAEDNPASTELSNDLARSAWGEDEAKMRMLGMTAIDRLAVYPQFTERHVLKEDYQPGLYDSIYVTYDPGLRNKTGLGLWCFTKDEPNVAKLWRWWEFTGTTLSQEMDVLCQVLDGRAIEAFIADPAAKRRTKTGSGFISTIEMISEEMEKRGYKEGITEKIRQGFLTTRDNAEEMGSINGHNAGINDCRTSLERGLLKISPSWESGGRLAIQRLKAYQFKEPQSIYQGIGTVKAKNSEFPDCWRYLVRWKAKWFDRGPNPPSGYAIAPEDVSVEAIRKARSEEIARRAAKSLKKRRRTR